MSSPPPKKKLKAGGNWKKLQKVRSLCCLIIQAGWASSLYILQSFSSGDKGITKHQYPSKSVSSPKVEKGKDKMIDGARLRHSTAPAATTLPWFAEDLSPEDLALVRKSSNNGTQATATGDASDINVEDSRRKKLAILGGVDLSDEKKEPGTYVAIDCEMVGVGPEGSESVLARVSIVNWHGAILMDSFVKPQEKVTDYRTWVSGVRPQDLRDAPSFQEVQAQVAALIKGRVLVGHAIHNDLKALLLSHPRPLIRDTAQNKLCREIANSKYPSLRKLVALRLGIEIQKSGSEHSPVEDARATMALYRTLHADWQKTMRPPANAIIGKGWKKVEKKGTQSESTIAKSNNTIPSKTVKTNLNQDPEWWKKV